MPGTITITNLNEAFLFIYRQIGLMREETYRSELSPRQCLDNIEDIGSPAQKRVADLFWKIREEYGRDADNKGRITEENHIPQSPQGEGSCDVEGGRLASNV